eukprot:TRINITY_DN11811_c0_g1_i1.p1 TRINITY_DN11811_c0_g1~~TRINITY_DN11811_c0_g1_i1.p1  ORF type:complete len:354 (+),score=160.27 TRINITY_DN11811_c0_g1_i1:97-1062(+)
MAPRKWSSLYYSKFCAFPEFIPFQMNFPSEDTMVSKPGGVSYENYMDPGPAGPMGKFFVNPHFVHNKSTALDFSYNQPEGKYNFQGKAELKKGLMMAKLNIEQEFMDLPWGFLLSSDLPLSTAPEPDHLEVAARTAKGCMQFGVRAAVKKGKGLTMPPKLECVTQVNKQVKAGVHLQLGNSLQDLQSCEFRAHMSKNDYTGCVQAVALDSKDGPSALVTLRTPAFKLPDCSYCTPKVVFTAQGKFKAAGPPQEAKVVAEVDMCKDMALKFKGDMNQQCTASVIFHNLPGNHSLTLGATRTGSGKLQFGALLQHGYYSFLGW